MAAPSPKTTIPPTLRRIIEREEREAARLRAQFGDPEQALMAFVREYFDEDILADVARESREGKNIWDEDDERDER